jgi:hypothetical protein
MVQRATPITVLMTCAVVQANEALREPFEERLPSLLSI